MAFPSLALYDNELVADASVKDRVLSDLPDVEADDDLDEPVVFIDSMFPASFLFKWNMRDSCLSNVPRRPHPSRQLLHLRHRPRPPHHPGQLKSAAGAAMYERRQSNEESSLGAESKSNENEASLVVEYVQKLVRLFFFFFFFFSCLGGPQLIRRQTSFPNFSSPPTSRPKPSPSSLRTTRKSPSSPP